VYPDGVPPLPGLPELPELVPTWAKVLGGLALVGVTAAGVGYLIRSVR
jgi:hypothetical protein